MQNATRCGTMACVPTGRMVLGHPLLTIEAYLVDGLLIDTEPSAPAAEWSIASANEMSGR